MANNRQRSANKAVVGQPVGQSNDTGALLDTVARSLAGTEANGLIRANATQQLVNNNGKTEGRG